MLNSLLSTCIGISELSTFVDQIFVLTELSSYKQFHSSYFSNM